MTDFNALLQAVAQRPVPDGLADAMARVLPKYGMTGSQLRIANPVGQFAEETGGFKVCVENLNYSAEGLLKTWPSHFTPVEAQAYAHQPERIANRAYASRMGNGDEASGDGWRYRGRGLIQITGRAAYAQAAADTGLPLLEHPELLEEWGDASVAASCAFWRRAGCNELADADNIAAITKRINGAYLNFSARKAYVARAKAFLALEQSQVQQAPIPAPVADPAPAPLPEPTEPPTPVQGVPAALQFTPLWQNLLTMARDRLGGFGSGALTFVGVVLAWLHKLSPADAILLVGAGLFVLILVLYWGFRKEHHHEAEKQAALNTPPPGQPLISQAQLAEALSVLTAALAPRG